MFVSVSLLNGISTFTDTSVPNSSLKNNSSSAIYNIDERFHTFLEGINPKVNRIAQPTSLLLLPGPLWTGVTVPVRVPSIGQIDLFKNYLYSLGPCARKTNSWFIYIYQTPSHKQDATRGLFWGGILLVRIQSFSSRPVAAIPRIKEPNLPYFFTYKWRESHFPIVFVLCEMRTALSRILNSDRRVHFVRRKTITPQSLLKSSAYNGDIN